MEKESLIKNIDKYLSMKYATTQKNKPFYNFFTPYLKLYYKYLDKHPQELDTKNIKIIKKLAHYKIIKV